MGSAYASSATTNSVPANVMPTNLTISNLIVGNSSQYAPVPISFLLTNTGSLATGNISVKADIYGNEGYSGVFNLTALPAGQSESVLLYLSNASRSVGGGVVYLSSGYVSGNQFYISGNGIGTYMVSSSNYAYGIEQGQFNSIAGLDITSVPLFAYLLPGQSFLSDIGFAYYDPSPLTITISTPSLFNNLLSFSAKDLYMAQNDSILSSLDFNPQNPNTYIIPITISGASGTSSSSFTRYMQMYVVNAAGSAPQIFEQVVLYNDGNSAKGTIEVNNPTSSNIQDAKLELMLPANSTANLSDINVYGAPATLSYSNSTKSYIVDWRVGDIARGENSYLYFNITPPLDEEAIANGQLFLSAVQETNRVPFSIINFTSPTLYTDSVGQVNVGVLYTGAAGGTVKFVLSTPPSANMTVSNESQQFNIKSNQVVVPSFSVFVGNSTGTVLMKLYANMGGLNSTYTVPVVVLKKRVSLISQTTDEFSRYRYEILIAAFVVMALIAYFAGARPKRIAGKYARERASRLRLVREQIDRDRYNG